jgi:hypothetical protein
LIGQFYSADPPGKAKNYENSSQPLLFSVSSTVSVEMVKGTVSLDGYMLLKLNHKFLCMP